MKKIMRVFSITACLILIMSLFSAGVFSFQEDQGLEKNLADNSAVEDGYPFSEDYPSVQQLNDWYDNVVAENPDITKKVHLGESWEGRDIWTIKVSDNVEEEENEPDVFIHGNLHSREWSTNQVSAYYLWRIVEDYGTNETITWLVNNREIYVAPIVNPDGYIHDGNGDLGLTEGWRKNRNDSTSTTSIGVDLNRNWDIDWESGSDDPSSSTYHGETPFSEYETQHLRDFILSKDIDSYQDLHSHAGTLLIPWGHTSQSSPHDSWYRDMASDMTSMTSQMGDSSQEYSYGQPSEEIGYSAPGGSYDWVYEKTGAIGMCYELYTPGSGMDGFYPDEEYIMDINQDVYDSLVYQARISDIDLGDGSENLNPPSPYIVYGNVEDSSGASMKGAEISVQHQETGETLTAQTDQNGYYEFNFGNLVDNGYDEGDTFTIESGDSTKEITVGDEWGTRKDLIVEDQGVPTSSFTYSPTSPTVGETIDFTDESTDTDGTIESWSWSFGDGYSSDTQNPSHSYSSAGTYTVELTVTDDSGKSDTAQQEIVVTDGSPEADFIYEPEVPIEGETVQFTDQSADPDGTIESWSWSFGDGSSSTSQNPTHSYSSSGTYTVEMTVEDNDGKTATATRDITVEEPSYSSVSGGDTSYGEYLSNVQFNGINKDSGDDGGYADYTGSVSDNVEPGQTYELSVTMRTGGYSDYVSVVIDWDQDYDLSDDQVIEIGSGTSEPQIVTTMITVPSDAAEGQTRMRVMQEYDSYHTDPTSDQSYGETEDYTISIGTDSTNEPPTASFSYSPTSPTTEDTLDFTDESTDSDGSISSWSWTFGDGTTSSSQNPSHSYDSNGTYTVELKVEDDEGATDTTTKDITVEDESGGEYCTVEGGDTSYGEYITNVQFNGINRDSGDDGGYVDHTGGVSNDVEPGQTYELSVTMSTGGYSDYVTVVIDWDRDYDLSNDQVIEVGYGSSEPQTITTSITVPSDAEEGQTRMRVIQEYDSYHTNPCTNQNYGETEDYTVSIGTDSGTNDPPTASFSYLPTSPTTEDTLDFTDESIDSDGSISSWDWSFGDGTSSDSQNPSYSYSSSGTYTVELTVTDDDGATDTTSQDIVVEETGGSYSSVSGGDTSYGEYITNVQFNGINRDSGDDDGYGDHTDSVSNSLEPGETYELSVTMNTGGYSDYVSVVIDWDQDYDLSDNQVIEVGYGSSDPETVSTTITVPSDAAEGQTRMRVMQAYNGYHTDPTVDQSYGETEDYTVSIGSSSTLSEVDTNPIDYQPDLDMDEENIDYIKIPNTIELKAVNTMKTHGFLN